MEKSKGGRKPYQDRSLLKVQLPVYIQKATIDKLGGNSKVRQIIEEYLSRLQ